MEGRSESDGGRGGGGGNVGHPHGGPRLDGLNLWVWGYRGKWIGLLLWIGIHWFTSKIYLKVWEPRPRVELLKAASRGNSEPEDYLPWGGEIAGEKVYTWQSFHKMSHLVVIYFCLERARVQGEGKGEGLVCWYFGCLECKGEGSFLLKMAVIRLTTSSAFVGYFAK